MVFWAFLTCLVTTVKNDSINSCKTSDFYLLVKNQLHFELLPGDIAKILQVCVGTLGMPGQKHQKIFIFFLEILLILHAGFDLSFWGAIMKIYLFATLCWVNKDQNMAQQIFSVTKNKFIVWNYYFFGPTSIYLVEFNNINNRIKCKICLKLTIEVTCCSGVSITNFEYIWHVVLVCFC